VVDAPVVLAPVVVTVPVVVEPSLPVVVTVPAVVRGPLVVTLPSPPVVIVPSLPVVTLAPEAPPEPLELPAELTVPFDWEFAAPPPPHAQTRNAIGAIDALARKVMKHPFPGTALSITYRRLTQ
jgi:hypothetical protein